MEEEEEGGVARGGRRGEAAEEEACPRAAKDDALLDNDWLDCWLCWCCEEKSGWL